MLLAEDICHTGVIWGGWGGLLWGSGIHTHKTLILPCIFYSYSLRISLLGISLNYVPTTSSQSDLCVFTIFEILDVWRIVA